MVDGRFMTETSLQAVARKHHVDVPMIVGSNSYEASLAQQLKKGPVVLYFYPAAFTKGCTIEAHEFADAVDEYERERTTV